MNTRPEIACKMKIREVFKYSGKPAYEVLLFARGNKHWHALRMSNGARALFTRPPISEQEARQVIRKFEEQRDVAVAA